MDVEIVSEEENPMLHRSDVTFELVHPDATPARLQVRDSLAAKLNKDADEVVIRELDTKFGMRKTVGYAKVYETAEFAASVEQEHMLLRNKIGDVAEEAADEPDETAAEDEEEAESEEAVDEEEDEETEEAVDEAEEDDEAEGAADDDAAEDEEADDAEEEEE